MRLQLLVVITVLILAPLGVIAPNPLNPLNALKKFFPGGSSSGTRPRLEFPADWDKFNPVAPTYREASEASVGSRVFRTHAGLKDKLSSDGQWQTALRVRYELSPWQPFIDEQGRAEQDITELREKGRTTPEELLLAARHLGDSYLNRQAAIPEFKHSLFAAKSRRLYDIDISLTHGREMLKYAIAQPDKSDALRDLHKTLALTASRLQELREDFNVLTPILRNIQEPPLREDITEREERGLRAFIEERRQDITTLTEAHKNLLKLAHQESVKKDYKHLKLNFISHWGPAEDLPA